MGEIVAVFLTDGWLFAGWLSAVTLGFAGLIAANWDR